MMQNIIWLDYTDRVIAADGIAETNCDPVSDVTEALDPIVKGRSALDARTLQTETKKTFCLEKKVDFTFSLY
jgi:hypothetical protein